MAINSLGEAATLSVSREVVGALRASVVVQADRAPSLGDRVYVAAGAVGVSARRAGVTARIDLLAGAGWVRGPIDATSFAMGVLLGADVAVERATDLGLNATYVQLDGAQPAGDASVGTFGLELRYRWR